MKILLWILANWDSIAILLVALLGLFLYIRRNGIKAIKALLLAWITEVEAECGGGTGLLKKAKVAAKIYATLPGILKIIIPERVISLVIESGLKYAKTVWSTNTAIAAVASGAILAEDSAKENNSLRKVKG